MAGSHKPHEARSLDEYLDDPRSVLPPIRSSAELAELIADIQAASGAGSTVSPYFGNMMGQSFYAVSVEPALTRKIPGLQMDTVLLRSYIREQAEYLIDPCSAIGTWYNPEEDVTYLDVVLLVRSLRTARRLGRQFDQIGIFDLHAETPDAERFIDTGGIGMGTGAETWPPYKDRLPKRIRRRRKRRA